MLPVIFNAGMGLLNASRAGGLLGTIGRAVGPYLGGKTGRTAATGVVVEGLGGESPSYEDLGKPVKSNKTSPKSNRSLLKILSRPRNLILTGAAGLLGSSLFDEETPVVIQDDSGTPDLEKDGPLRFEQVLFPNVGGSASNEELFNAALLAASLEMLTPIQPGETVASKAVDALEAGRKVSTGGSIYPTPQSAYKAAQDAFGKGATIKVYPKGNGYSFTAEMGFGNLFGSESGEGESSDATQNDETIDMGQGLLKTFQAYKEANPAASDEQLKDMMKKDIDAEDLSDVQKDRAKAIIDTLGNT